ncbi:UNVERIFIED_CONTAM: hypothetical protein GTU68_041220 [Idotea baltica]|nr:hypothetical protein [Idotea baltica]
MSFHERIVLFFFVILVFMWFFLAPGFMPGWGGLFIYLFGHEAKVEDATPVMLIVFILFCIPSRPNFLCIRDPKASKYPSSSPGCLTWKVAQEKIPWGIVLLMGGGFAMAKGAQDSGLSYWLGQQLQYFEFMPPWLLLFCICILTAMATEITSNAATASVLLPVLKDLSLALCINPLYLMLPATLCCSYAFMLPVATPPNAIVFGAANIDSKVMMKAGFVPNILCVLVVTFMINTYAIPVLGISTMPAWANSSSNGVLPNC